ncbi:lactonase family protein [Granulicella aggregans]|uniref:lactonase family protein n=1 Tax=Granulicella aggregans TaxID=474949 RepID=UPI0021DFD7B8|nr:lactonase family protein [Granulicella aggregans]
MNSITRRAFLATSAASTIALRSTFASAQSTIPGKLLLVGTQTAATSKGVYAYSFDSVSGELKKVGLAAAAANPTFLCMTPDRKTVIVANETEDFGGQKSGAVSTFSLDTAAGTMTQLSQQASRGGSPCHVTTDHTGTSVFAANYSGGSAISFKLLGGKLSDAVSFEQYTGHGPNAERQEGPHAHRVTVSPDNKYLLVNDLGLDLIHVYALDAATGKLTPADTPAWKAPAGVGPRTLHFHPNGKYAYCVCEMSCQIIVLKWDADAGTLTTGQIAQLPLQPHPGEVTGCDIVLDKTARFGYYINRGDDFVATIAISADGSRLTFQRRSSCGGKIPRHLTLDPTERFLLVANQESDNIAVFPRDVNSGQLSEIGKSYPLSKPQCLVFPRG